MSPEKNIVRVKRHPKDFLPICNATLRDDNLSFKARGLLCFLLSFPEDWRVNYEHIVNSGPDGADSVRSAFKELEKAGYAGLLRLSEGGKMAGSRWVIVEIPEMLENAMSESDYRDAGFPESGIPETRENTDYERRISTKDKEERNTVAPFLNLEAEEAEDKTLAKLFPFPELFESSEAINLLLQEPGFADAWRQFVADRKEKRKPLTKRAADPILTRCAERPKQAAEALRLCYQETGWLTFQWEWIDKRGKQQSKVYPSIPSKLPPRIAVSIAMQKGAQSRTGKNADPDLL